MSATGNSYKELATKLREDLEPLKPPLSRECCIYRVPSNLRRVNEVAYTPDFVSIGPLHYGDENVKKMEEHKLRYLKRFLKRAEERGEERPKSLEDFVLYIKGDEERVRRCYAATFDHFNSDDFARMILVDASFVIEHMLRRILSYFGSEIKVGGKDPVSYLNGTAPIDEAKEGHQLIFDIPHLSFAVITDLILLENQLPFFVLEGLFRMVYEQVSFSDLSHIFFSSFNRLVKTFPKDIKHFTDLVRYYLLPEEEEKEQTQTPTVPTHSIRVSDCSSWLSKVWQPREDDEENSALLYSATQLHEAGVTFKKSKSKCFLKINFTGKGVLEMPRFTIADNTEAVIRNVMALERCHYPGERRVCECLVLMDCLINTDEDVDLLVQNKILDHKLGSNQQVASMVNKLGLEISRSGRNSLFFPTIKRLNEYYEVPYHKWLAALTHIYFKTPWRSASTIAAITLLLLTLGQTICSFLSLYS